jgi:anaphase-promoting complex subunit 11
LLSSPLFSPDCKFPGDDCPPMWGACNHPFHMHCILKWLKSQAEKNHKEECPLCRADWEIRG